LWEPITKSAFPRNTRQHVYTNGGIETVLGLQRRQHFGQETAVSSRRGKHVSEDRGEVEIADAGVRTLLLIQRGPTG
jgi:hypothetical protein